MVEDAVGTTAYSCRVLVTWASTGAVMAASIVTSWRTFKVSVRGDFFDGIAGAVAAILFWDTFRGANLFFEMFLLVVTFFLC